MPLKIDVSIMLESNSKLIVSPYSPVSLDMIIHYDFQLSLDQSISFIDYGGGEDYKILYVVEFILEKDDYLI